MLAREGLYELPKFTHSLTHSSPRASLLTVMCVAPSRVRRSIRSMRASAGAVPKSRVRVEMGVSSSSKWLARAA